MIVRCGNCQVELEVNAPGEFACPSCGTRNVVRGGEDPLSLGGPSGGALGPDLDLGALRPAPVPLEETPLDWFRCPSCRFRFVVGDGITEAPCPSCTTPVEISESNRA